MESEIDAVVVCSCLQILTTAHDMSCPPVQTVESNYIRIDPVHHGGWPSGIRTNMCRCVMLECSNLRC